MRKLIILLLLLMIMLTACRIEEPEGESESVPTETAVIELPTEPEHIHEFASEPQTVEDPVSGYCGNTVTTVYVDGQEYSFWGNDSVALTDILINLDYDAEKLCRCIAEYQVDTEFGSGYSVNITEGFARCEEGQADLTAEQVETIRDIIDSLARDDAGQLKEYLSVFIRA